MIGWLTKAQTATLLWLVQYQTIPRSFAVDLKIDPVRSKTIFASTDGQRIFNYIRGQYGIQKNIYTSVVECCAIASLWQVPGVKMRWDYLIGDVTVRLSSSAAHGQLRDQRRRRHVSRHRYVPNSSSAGKDKDISRILTTAWVQRSRWCPEGVDSYIS